MSANCTNPGCASGFKPTCLVNRKVVLSKHTDIVMNKQQLHTYANTLLPLSSYLFYN